MSDWLQTALFGYDQVFFLVYFVDYSETMFLFSLVSANWILPTLPFRKLSHIFLKLCGSIFDFSSLHSPISVAFFKYKVCSVVRHLLFYTSQWLQVWGEERKMELWKTLTVNSSIRCRRTGTCNSSAVTDDYSDMSTCQDLSDAFPIQNSLKKHAVTPLLFNFQTRCYKDTVISMVARTVWNIPDSDQCSSC